MFIVRKIIIPLISITVIVCVLFLYVELILCIKRKEVNLDKYSFAAAYKVDR